MPTPNLVEPLPHPMRQLRSMPIRCLYSIYLFFLHAQSDGLCPSCLSTMPVRYRRDYLCSRESLLDHIHTVTRPPCHCIRMPLAFFYLAGWLAQTGVLRPCVSCKANNPM